MSIKDIRQSLINDLNQALKDTKGRGHKFIIREKVNNSFDEITVEVNRKIKELLVGGEK